MKNKRFDYLLAIVVAALCGGWFHARATPLGTAFTYQGRLVTGSGPASGIYELVFNLYDAPTNGVPIGPANYPPLVMVTGGVFVVTLDFGNVFQGDLRYLEIMARTNGGPTWTTLPRQPLTPSPNAEYATLAGGLPGLTVTPETILVQTQRTDQYNAPGGVTLLPITPNETVWQSFAAGLSGTLQSVWVSGMGQANLSLYAGEGTNGTQLYGGPPVLLSGGTYVPAVANMTAGSKYTFALTFVSCAPQCRLSASTTDTYAGGHCSRGGDLMFATILSSYTYPRYNLGLGTQPDTAGTLSINGSVTATALAGNFTGSASGTFTGSVSGTFSGTALGSFAGDGAGLTNLTLADGSVTAAKLASDHLSLNKVSAGALFADGSGRIGVGTGSPGESLDVSGTFQVQNQSGSFRYTGWPPGDGIACLAKFTGADTNGPQLRFQPAVSGGFVDIGQDGAGNFVVEQSDIPAFLISPDGRLIGNGAGLTNVVPGLSVSEGFIQVPQEAVDQSQQTGGAPLANAYPYRIWQSFTPSVSGNLVEVRFSPIGTSTIELYLFAGEGDAAPANALFHLVGTPEHNYGNTNRIRMPADGSTYLTAGQKYTLVWQIYTDGNATGLQISPTESYADGQCMVSGIYLGPGPALSYTLDPGDVVFSTVMDTRMIPNYQVALGASPNSAGSVTVSGPVTASRFVGDGSGLTNVIANGSVTAAQLASDADSLSKVSGGTIWADSRYGFVGIGVELPFAGLHVHSATAPAAIIESDNQHGTWLKLDNTSSGGRRWNLISSGYLNTEGPGKLLFLDETANAVRMVLDTSGNVGIGTNSPACKLDVAGEVAATAVNITSDRNAKEQFTTVEPRAVLDKVLRLPISEWQFKDQPGVRHLGPVAQDFHAAFDLGRDEKHIATVDADGVALAAIQGLNAKLDARDAQIARLRAENESLAGRLAEIEKKLGLAGSSQPSKTGSR